MKTIAFYLPQFHAIPENDSWWGKGFTEWTNVKKASALFPGHRQPQVPGTLGYYDLNSDETRMAQAELAKSHGIDAFCYYHYWFEGKQLLEMPVNKMLKNKAIDMPFCICWANETWSRAWDGQEKEILMEQKYSDDDDVNHAKHLCEIFSDSRYLKIEGKPLFVIYRVANLPNPKHFVDALKAEAQKCGFEDVLIMAVRNFASNVPDEKLSQWGIHDIIDFEPNPEEFPKRSLLGKGWRWMQRQWNALARKVGLPQVNSILRVPYNKVAENAIALYKDFSDSHYPTVFPNWDNSPRRKAATIIQNDNPQDFEKWVKTATKLLQKRPEQKQLLFVNAWNEWAESAHLEPDAATGAGFLEAFKRGIGK